MPLKCETENCERPARLTSKGRSYCWDCWDAAHRPTDAVGDLEMDGDGYYVGPLSGLPLGWD